MFLLFVDFALWCFFGISFLFEVVLVVTLRLELILARTFWCVFFGAAYECVVCSCEIGCLFVVGETHTIRALWIFK